MKWINAEQQVTVSIYDDEHEEYLDKIMTVEEMLDTYTNEGCPTMYSNPEQARWIPVSERLPEKDGEYLVTIRWRNNYAVDNYSVVKRKYYADVKTWDDSLVIAYVPQPLPQPYKAESEEEE